MGPVPHGAPVRRPGWSPGRHGPESQIPCDSLRAPKQKKSLEVPGRSDLATAPWPRDIGRLSARSLACVLPCVPCPGSLQGQSQPTRGASRKARVTNVSPSRVELLSPPRISRGPWAAVRSPARTERTAQTGRVRWLTSVGTAWSVHLSSRWVTGTMTTRGSASSPGGPGHGPLVVPSVARGARPPAEAAGGRIQTVGCSEARIPGSVRCRYISSSCSGENG
jgi:hypothetical protein